MYLCCAITNKGIRPHNEDAMLIHKTVLTDGVTEAQLGAPFLIGVADGVSGERSGEMASQLCMEMLSTVQFNSRTDLDSKLMEIHQTLCERGTADDELRNMQTTLCAVGIDENELIHTINVGDSRLYRYRSGILEQLSRDQSLVQMLYEEGSITRAEREHHKRKNIIFPVLGNLKSLPIFDIQELEQSMEYGDVLLLCSDGLSDYVSSAEIEEGLAMAKPLVRRLQLLIELALQSGG
ncbi:MAG: protein phosphatase 2C domain-containing protein, partial [Oscillospiraceae bacterium]|nr:protein phosphatase 2C domain-containing protein [Oscillospiraceae bacterium]